MFKHDIFIILLALSCLANADYGRGNFFFISETDTTPPTITIISPVNTTYNLTDSFLTLSASADEVISIWWYSINGSSNITFTPPIDFTIGNGSNFLQLWANDSSNNVGYSDVWFYVNITSKTLGNATCVAKKILIVQDNGKKNNWDMLIGLVIGLAFGLVII